MATTPRVKQKARLSIEVLDRSRPFGEVFGDAQHSIKYTQNARKLEAWPYDAHDNLVEEALNDKQAALLATLRAQAEANAKTAAEKAPVEEDTETDAPEATTADDEIEPDAVGVPDDDGINLVLWLKGELRVRNDEIQKVLKARYGVNKPSMNQQALYLVEEQKLLPRDQVHPRILPKPAV